MISGDQEPVLQAVGFVMVTGRHGRSPYALGTQFTAHRACRGAFWRALAFFLVGGAVRAASVADVAGEPSSATRVDYAPRRSPSCRDNMLADIGRIDTADPTVTAPLWVRALIGTRRRGRRTRLDDRSCSAPRRAPAPSRSPTRRASERCCATSGEWDSLGYFATRRDKAVVWDTGDPGTARAGVSYRVVGSVSLASGNPVGDPTQLGRLRSNGGARRPGCTGWSLAVMGAGRRREPLPTLPKG